MIPTSSTPTLSHAEIFWPNHLPSLRGPASTKTNLQNATKLGDVDRYLGAQCEPGMYVHRKIASGNFYIAKSEKKSIYRVLIDYFQIDSNSNCI